MATALATLTALAPAIAAGATAAAGLRLSAARALGMAGSALSIVAAMSLLAGGQRGVAVAAEWAPELLVSLSWRLETAPLGLAVLVAGIGALVKQYAGTYFAKSNEGPRILALLGAFESAMLGLTLADNLFVLFVFWELTGIVSFYLIMSDPAKLPKSYRSARHAFLVTVAGGLPMLVAILVLAASTGTAGLSQLRELDLPLGLRTFALALVLPAVLTKSAQAPFHFWLPGAMAAPTPVSAYLHSATMVKAGIILLLYLYPVLGASPLWSAALVPLGVATCIWGSYRALGEEDIKLLMAWSTVSQLGLLTLTIGLGTDLAIRAASLHLFAHAVFKAGLFLSVGAVDYSAGTRRLTELGGVGRGNLPLMVTVAVLAGSMAGLPPLAGFLSKELILKKAMLVDWWVHVPAIGGIVLGSIGTIAYCSRFFFEVFTGSARSPKAAAARPAKLGLLVAPAALAVISLGAGPGAYWIDRWFLEPFAASLLMRPLEAPELSLWYGLNAAFILSVAIVTVGYALDRALGLRFLRCPFGVGGAQALDGALDWSQSTGARLVKALSGAPPNLYLALALAPAILALPALWNSGGVPPEGWNRAGSLTLLFMATSLTALIYAQTRLTKVLLLSACGFAVAFLFRLMNAPDLMLTQLLVEVLVTILFALTLRQLHPLAPGESPPPWRLGPTLFSLAGGLAAGALTLAVGQAGASAHVREFYLEAGPAIAKGLNLVNVVLTDFRALDTLMETLVVVLAAMGVGGLMRGLERRPPELSKRPPDSGGAPTPEGLLPVMARLVLPISAVFAVILLIKGHNQPGGGFVAGLALSVGAVLTFLTAGPGAFDYKLRVSSQTMALLGTVLMLASCLASAPSGSALTHFHGDLPLPGLRLKLSSVLIFDLGVALAVAGGVGAAARLLWTATRRAKGGRP